jgi:hypothetical protein
LLTLPTHHSPLPSVVHACWQRCVRELRLDDATECMGHGSKCWQQHPPPRMERVLPASCCYCAARSSRRHRVECSPFDLSSPSGSHVCTVHTHASIEGECKNVMCLFVAECMCPSIHDEIHVCLDMDVGAMGAIASIRLQPQCAHCATRKHNTHTTTYVARARWHTTHYRSSLWPTSTITTLCTTTHRARGSRCMQHPC